MFESLKGLPPDPILALSGYYRADERPQKLDLGVGVYKDPQGRTPVMAAVKAAERRLVEGQDSKTYIGMRGSEAFVDAVAGLLFGAAGKDARIAGVQTPGGSGALRVLAELAKRAAPGATVWLSDPTWPNHGPVMQAAGLKTARYPYYDMATGTVRVEEMLAALAAAPAGDIVLLHGCCHNPTGADLDAAAWERVIDILLERRLVPFVDIAYQGLGDGLEEDAAGLRALVARVPEALVATSCSKNFGLYRDRVGAAYVLCRSAQEAQSTLSELTGVVRTSYSMPPDHGAAVVAMILTDPDLRAQWQGELDAMRARVLTMRQALAREVRARNLPDRFRLVGEQRGMFSLLGLSDEVVGKLRHEHAVYVVPGGRINVAGFSGEAAVAQFAAALSEALS